MAIEDMNSYWQYMESFRLYFKEVIASSLATIADYSVYFKTQILYYAAQMQVWLARAWAHLGTGFKVAYEWCWAFIKNIPAMAKYAWNTAINWLIQGFHYGYRFCKFLLNVAEIVLRHLWTQVCVLAEALYNFIWELPELLATLLKQIPYYLDKAWLFIKECAMAIKEGLLKMGELLLPYLKDAWHQISTFISTLLTQAAKRFFMGIGIVYGISSALVETLGAGINALSMKVAGFNLANYGAFATIQTGLSIALAVVLTAAIAYYSYKAIRALYRTVREHGPRIIQVMHDQRNQYGQRLRAERRAEIQVELNALQAQVHALQQPQLDEEASQELAYYQQRLITLQEELRTLSEPQTQPQQPPVQAEQPPLQVEQAPVQAEQVPARVEQAPVQVEQPPVTLVPQLQQQRSQANRTTPAQPLPVVQPPRRSARIRQMQAVV